MIFSKLSSLMRKDKLTITKLANDTNISRTTLTSLFHNSGNGIQFDTINVLCDYFGIEINELLVFVPYDIEINIGVISEDNFCDDEKFSKCLVDCEIVFTGVRGKEKNIVPLDLLISINENKEYIVYDCDLNDEDLFYYQEFIDSFSYEVYEIILYTIIKKTSASILKQLSDIDKDWQNYDIQPVLVPLIKWDKWKIYNYLFDKINGTK